MKAKQHTAHQNGLVQAPSGIWLPQQTRSNHQALNGKQPAGKRHPWTEKVIAGKTLWEWMSLLLVPLLVGIGTIVVTWQQTYAQNALSQQLHNSDQRQHASDQNIAQQARYDDLLKNYRDGVDTLLLTGSLRTAPSGSDVRRIAHSRTLDVLRQVDINRKGAVVAYLADLGLVQGGNFDNTGNWHKEEPVVSLSRADLHGANLSRTDLHGVNLYGANLNRANFYGTDLIGANFYGADLGEATISGAALSSTNLIDANLTAADLTRANLNGAYLNDADLREARNTTPSQLAAAASLSGTIMPNGTKHP